MAVQKTAHIRPKTRPNQYKQRPKLAVKKPKANPAKGLVQLIFALLLGYYVMPVMYLDYFSPIFLNPYRYRAIKMEVTPLNSPRIAPEAVGVSEFYFPKTYGNSELFGRKVITPQPKKPEMSKIATGTQMLDLTSSLKDLAAKYKNLEPSIFVWDYSSAQYVDINASSVMASASIIKIPVLFELFKQIESDKLSLKDTMLFEEIYRSSGSGSMQNKPAGMNYSLDELANLMITESDNTATNMLITQLGGIVNVNRAIRSWGLKNTQISNWLPDLGGGNLTTARDIATILYNIDSPTFFNMQSKEYIVDYMSKVKNTTLLKAGLPKNASLVHKTGDIGTMLGDAGIVYTDSGKKYIVVIMSKRPHNDSSAKDFTVKASQLIYKTIEAKVN